MIKYFLNIFTFDTENTSIWNSNLFTGIMHLHEGKYPNKGHVEIYCNGQWGMLCHAGFDSNDAQTICKQFKI